MAEMHRVVLLLNSLLFIVGNKTRKYMHHQVVLNIDM